MPFDQHKNLAIAVVAVAPSPPDTGLTLTVAAGHGVRYPVPPFDVTIWLATKYPNPDDAEVARCTALAGDVLTLVRAQGGTTARMVQVGDLIAESITAQYLQSLEAAIGTTPSPPTLHAPTHAEGGTDPVQLTQSQVTGLTTSLTTIEGDITTLEGDVANLQTIVTSGPVALHAPTHETGGTDPITGDLSLASVTTSGDITSTTGTVSAVIVTGQGVSATVQMEAPLGVFTTVNGDTAQFNTSVTSALGSFGSLGATPLNATNLLTGTVPDVRLSVNVLKHTGGYPGGTVNFLRADGTFAAPAGGGGGIPALHAPTHLAGGTDPITITGLAGFPGGTVNFLRADGTFATPAGSGGAPALHAATHTPGNTDPIPNVGWTNVANTWTLAQTHSGTADLIFSGTGRVRWGSLVGDPQLKRNGATLELRTGTDSAFTTFKALLVASDITTGTLPLARIQFSGSPRLLGRGTAAAGGSEEITLGTGLTMTGTVLSASGGGAPAAHAATHVFGSGSDVIPNVGWTNVANTWQQDQTFEGQVVMANTPSDIRRNGVDTGWLNVTGGGATNTTRGAVITLYGNTSPFPGKLLLSAGNVAGGTIEFNTGNTLRGTMHPSGGFSWGSTGDPGAGAITASGGARFTGLGFGTGSGPGGMEVCYAADTGYVQAYDRNLGGYKSMVLAGSQISFLLNGSPQGVMYGSGGFSWGWGATGDPGYGHVAFGGYAYFGNIISHYGVAARITLREPNFSNTHGCINLIPGADYFAGLFMTFCGAAGGIAGSISQTGGTTIAFNASSDARLKTDRGRLTDTSVLERTIVHVFDWKSDGRAGRGVFAQEAVEVAPFAVDVGTDERNDDGVLTHPWGVDYSKYVPDLIAGWQRHEAELAELKAELALLRGSH